MSEARPSTRSDEGPTKGHRLSTLVTAFFFITLTACSGKNSQHDTELEVAILNTINAMKDTGVNEMHLRSLPAKSFDKLCVQRPYMNRDKFERESNIVASDFEFASDDRHIWWFVHSDGSAKWIVIQRVKIADLDRRFNKTCVGAATSTLRINRDKSGFSYTFEE